MTYPPNIDTTFVSYQCESCGEQLTQESDDPNLPWCFGCAEQMFEVSRRMVVTCGMCGAEESVCKCDEESEAMEAA